MRLVSLQYLRAAAAVMVVLHHARDQSPYLLQHVPTAVGAAGVDVFFVISGFVMVYTTGLRPVGAGEFMRRRLVRIAPLYWAITGLTAALLIAEPGLVSASVFTWSSFVQSLLFIPHANPGAPSVVAPMLKLGWTLNYEMGFYLLFAAALALRLSVRARVAAVAAALFTGVAVLAMAGPAGVAATFYGQPIVLEFTFGCGLALFGLHGGLTRVGAAGAMALLAAGAALVVAGSAAMDTPWRFLSCGLPATMIVGGAVAAERAGLLARRWRLAAFLGDASYAIYLAHLYAAVFFRLLWARLHLPGDTAPSAAMFALACAIFGVGAGVATHLLVERPLTRWIGGRAAAWQARTPTPATS